MTIFVSAGEASGDLHGAALVRALRERLPRARFIGLGGSRMAAEGVELLADLSQLAVMGVAEVVRRLPTFFRLRRRVFATLDDPGVDLVIPIDYPGFNLRLARRAKSRSIPVLFYIAPQVWAWHRSRARDLARDADRVAVILPFEESFLREYGADAQFVGHPLLDLPLPAGWRQDWAKRVGVDANRPVLALLPGSREQEIERHLDLFSAAAERVRARRPDVQPVIGAAADLPADLYRGAPWPAVRDARALLEHATAALVKSGTSTLDAALAGTPFVVAYRTSSITYTLARWLVDVPHVALANLVAERRVVPEFLQDGATPAALADALLPLLEAGATERNRIISELAAVRDRLGGPGAAERVADMAIRMLDPGAPARSAQSTR